jgi:hypothetical protein
MLYGVQHCKSRTVPFPHSSVHDPVAIATHGPKGNQAGTHWATVKAGYDMVNDPRWNDDGLTQ